MVSKKNQDREYVNWYIGICYAFQMQKSFLKWYALGEQCQQVEENCWNTDSTLVSYLPSMVAAILFIPWQMAAAAITDVD